MESNNSDLEFCLENYHQYHHSILLPAINVTNAKISRNNIKLFEAIGFNLIMGHVLDYLLAIEKKRNISVKSRREIMLKLDLAYQTHAGKFRNNKFQLVDAVSNSIKHISLDAGRYEDVINEYGDMTFRLLSEENGIVYLKTGRYQFDYGRVVLRNLSGIFDFIYDEPEIILGVIDGESCCRCDDIDDDSIDRMITHCNRPCIDCGESEDECFCEDFIFGDIKGEFNPFSNEEFDIEATMAEISSSYK